LRDAQIMLREKFRVSGHEPRLADGGAGLKFGEVAGAFFKTERAHARADCAAADDDDFASRFSLRGDLRDELLQLRRINLFPAVGQHAGAEFDDGARGGRKRLAMHAPEFKEIAARGKC
jgi:hypothetical protein